MVGKSFRMLACLTVVALLVAVLVPVMASAADPVTITGTLEKGDAGLVVKAEKGDYVLSGGKLEALQAELEKAVGQKVAVTGVASKEGEKNLFAPEAFELAK